MVALLTQPSVRESVCVGAGVHCDKHLKCNYNMAGASLARECSLANSLAKALCTRTIYG